MKTSINNFKSPTGIDLQVESMSKDGAEMFIKCVMAEHAGAKIDLHNGGLEVPFLTQIVLKRIEGLKLPITFTPIAALGINALVNNPGRAVCLLVDALNKHEGETVTMEKLSELYPFGFYTEDSFEKYVDEYLKPRKVKWAEIY